MPRSILHTQQARYDLIGIWNYFDEVGAAPAGSNLLRKIARTLDMLAVMPEIAPVRRELRQDLRSFSVSGYIVYFDFTATELRVIRVIHGARDIGAGDFDES